MNKRQATLQGGGFYVLPEKHFYMGPHFGAVLELDEEGVAKLVSKFSDLPSWCLLGSEPNRAQASVALSQGFRVVSELADSRPVDGPHAGMSLRERCRALAVGEESAAAKYEKFWAMARELEDLMRHGRSEEEGDRIRFLLKLVMGKSVKIEMSPGALTITFCDGCKLCSVS